MEVLVLVLAAEHLLHPAPIVFNAITGELAVPLWRHHEDVASRAHHRLERRRLVCKVRARIEHIVHRL